MPTNLGEVSRRPLPPCPAERLKRVLATYIMGVERFRSPGSDGVLLEDVVQDYPAFALTGAVPGQDELCCRHPDLAQAVGEFFDHTPPSSAKENCDE